MQHIRINLVEDEPEIRERLAAVIEESNEYSLLNAAANLQSAQTALEKYQPDIVLVDLGLPDGSGIDLIKTIQTLKLTTMALVISGFQDEKNVFSALEAGAQGYLLKHESGDTILDSIKQLWNGGSPISPIIARMMLRKFNCHVVESEIPESLTEKQAVILQHISKGFSSKEISEKMNISYYTVTTHIKNIYNKLQVNSRTEAIYEAKKLGVFRED